MQRNLRHEAMLVNKNCFAIHLEMLEDRHRKSLPPISCRQWQPVMSQLLLKAT